MEISIRSKFALGQIFATRNAAETLDRQSMLVALQKHANADWGTVCKEDRDQNDLALIYGDRILSAYRDPTCGLEFWIITEADRSCTTFLLPDDY